MANLVKREHLFNELSELRHTFDRLFSRVLNHSTSADEPEARLIFAVPPIEAWVDNEKKEYHLSIAVPGVDPKEVQLNLHGNNLTISGEHKSTDNRKNADYLHQEFSYERFARRIVLPEGVETSKLTAEYKDGVLTVTLPKREETKPRQVKVNVRSASNGK